MSRSWWYIVGKSSWHLLSDRADRLGDKVSPWAVWLYCTKWCICERADGVCIWLHCICLYIHFIPSCRICDVFHSVFSVYIRLMYIFLSLFLCGWLLLLYCWIFVLFCCCTPGNDVDGPSPDMGRLSWYQSYQVQILWPGVKQIVYLRVEYNIHAIY